MAWAKTGIISTSPIEGGIAISELQYLAAIKGMAEGMLVSTEDGVLALVNPPKEEEPEILGRDLDPPEENP